MRAGLALSILQRPVHLRSAGAGASTRLSLPSSSPLSRPQARLSRIHNHLWPVARFTLSAFRADTQRSSVVVAQASAGMSSGDGLANAAELADPDTTPMNQDVAPWLERIEGSIARSRK
eukprot:3901423-Pyramimonas_sp.AAC.1